MLRLHDASILDAPPEDVISGRARQAEVQLVPRLLRRADGLRYVDAIHENVAPWLRRRGMKIAAVDADIVHLGATKEIVEAKSKTDRNIRLLRARVDQDPSDLSAYGYLVHDLMRSGATQEAFEMAERGWGRLEVVDRGALVSSIHRLATARAYLLIGAGRFDDARRVARHAQSLEGENPDFFFLEANANEAQAMRSSERAARRDLLVAARDGYAACVRLANRIFSQSFIFGASSWSGCTRVGIVQILLGEPAEALRAFDAALAFRPDDRTARLGRAEAMIDLGDATGALQRIEGLLDETSPDAWTLAALAVRKLGLQSDARLFAKRAVGLSTKGFTATHRRERLRELGAELTANEATSPSIVSRQTG
jgi:tetratricopeptide (TPR) repeat protein